MSEHALLGPSGSERWMACTPSARFEETFPEKTSEYAEEGSFAHLMAEDAVLTFMGVIPFEKHSQTAVEFKKSKWWNADMLAEVNDFGRWVKFRAEEMGTEVLLLTEQKLDTSEWVPEGFGRGDVVLVAPGILHVIDFKYGKGVPVEAQGNPQLKNYGLGAWSMLNAVYDIETVRVTTYQPRLDSIQDAEYSVEELLAWAESELKPKAQLAWAGQGEFVAGDHCRFCKGKAVCQARAEQTAIGAFREFTPDPDAFMKAVGPTLLNEEQITWWLARSKPIQKWLTDLEEYALIQAENHGKTWPGFKLVEGRSNRKYTDEDAVKETLELAEVKSFTKTEILGITAMEKLLGKKKFDALLSEFITKAPGKPTLVPDDDKRTALNTVEATVNAFKD